VQLPVDEDLAAVADGHPDGVQTESVGAGAAAGREQEPLAGQYLDVPAGGGDGDPVTGVVPADGGDRRGGEHRDALVGEDLLDRVADLGFLERGQPVQRLHHGDLDAEAGEQLGLFQADRVATNHDHGGGQRVEGHRGGRGQVAGAGQAVDGRYRRRRPGRHQVVARLDQRRPAVGESYLQHRRIRVAGEAGGTGQDGPAVLGGQVGVPVRPHRLDELTGGGPQRGPVHRPRLRDDTGEPGVHGRVPGLRGGQQRLGRYAAGVHTRPTHRGTLHHDHRQVPAPGGDRRGEPATPGTDDRQVVPHGALQLLIRLPG
jgi:hypothetical protein